MEVEFHEEKMTLTVTCPNGCDPDWKLWAIVSLFFTFLSFSCRLVVCGCVAAMSSPVLRYETSGTDAARCATRRLLPSAASWYR